MNNDGETSVTFEDDLYVSKYVRLLPAGQTQSGFRMQPLIQFYSDRMLDTHTGLRTVGLEEVMSIKGLTDDKIAKIVQQVRAGRKPEIKTGIKVAKTRRKKQLK